MLERVLGQVFRPFQDVDKDPLGGDVSVDGARHEQGRQGQAVCDSLDQHTSASLYGMDSRHSSQLGSMDQGGSRRTYKGRTGDVLTSIVIGRRGDCLNGTYEERDV